MRRVTRLTMAAAAGGALAFGLVAGVSASPALAQPGQGPTVCLVADPGGFDDWGLNSSMLAGAVEASRQLQVELITADPGDVAGIAQVVDAWASSGQCELIIGSGFISGGAMEASVGEFPDQRFAGIDYEFQEAGDTVSVHFRVDQGAFLAGYVAAAASSTGIVGVYGGAPYPSVTDFMNGYTLGVEYFNTTTGSSVQVLGWDVESQEGLFSNDFANPELGFALAEDLFAQGADTVFPVAGGTSLGSYNAAVARKSAGDEVRIVYPDADPFELFDRDQARVLLTSAEKAFDVATYHVIASLVDGSWAAGTVDEDLASGGVDIAPFHRTNNQVPGFVRPSLLQVRAGILDGTISTLP